MAEYRITPLAGEPNISAQTGEIPDYALKPHGGLTGTRIYWKQLV